MNDRYLYRAKRKDDGEWVEGYLVYDNFDHQYRIVIELDYSTGTCFNTMMAPRVDASTICQCTGAPDKNKKMIFENDIAWDSEERKFYKIIFSQEDMCYYAQDADGYKHTFESCYGSSIEVEGNIFNNPELLEVGE